MASKDVIDTLIAEAGGEGEAGLIAAAWAIQQRAAARGQTVDQVVKSGFDGYSNPGSGAVQAQQDPRLRAKVEQIMAGVQSGRIPNPVPGADHFLSGDVSPGWSKNMKLVATIGGHRFYASGNVPQAAYGPLIPPGELPEVASALSTAPMPRSAPAPVTPSPSIAALRRSAPPSQLISDTFASLSKPSRNLGDEIAMSPIQGGRQQAPMFDAAYDERTGTIRLTREPIDSQGIAVGRSSEPAPIPAVQSPQLAAKRATDPVLQAALNAKYPAQLPPLPAPAQPRPQVSGAMSYAGQDRATLPSPPVNVAAYSTLGRGSSVPEEYRYNTGLIGGPRINPSAPDRLAPGAPGMGIPGISGISPQQVAQIGLDVNGKAAPLPYQRPAGLGTSPVQVAKVAPIPFMRPDFPQVATALDVAPMPPMPIPRPKVAPVPFPRPDFGIGGPDLAPWPGIFGIKLPSIPRPMQTVAGRTAAFEPAMRQVMTGSPGRPVLTSAVAAQRGPGVSAQQAYERADRASVERAIAGASNSDAARRLNERLGNI